MADGVVNAAIQQLNLGYDGLQDRMLLRLGLSDKTEMTIWLTRRIVKAIWGMMQTANIAPLAAPDEFSPETQETLDNFAKAGASQPSAMRDMDFSETYDADRKPITKEPILPSDCKLLKIGQQTVLELNSREGHMARIPMNAELIQALTNMLQLTCKDAGWDLNLSSAPVVIHEPTTHHVIH